MQKEGGGFPSVQTVELATGGCERWKWFKTSWALLEENTPQEPLSTVAGYSSCFRRFPAPGFAREVLGEALLCPCAVLRLLTGRVV